MQRKFQMLKFTQILGLGSVLILSACASTKGGDDPIPPTSSQGTHSTNTSEQTYNENELVGALSTHLGVTAESAGSMVERLFRKQGRPVGYITGQEGGVAIAVGLRYGKGTLWMKDGRSQTVYWQGSSVGWDWGANGSKVFTLVYGLDNLDMIYRRFPGADGSAYLIAGMGVNYQRAEGITLVPIRSGVGARIGANVGYLSYSRKRRYFPL